MARSSAPNPRYETDMLRRAAEACRNFQKQAVGNKDWFSWVAPYLDRLADAAEGTDGPSEGLKK